MNVQHNLEKEVLAPYTHLLQVKGKQFRNRIVMAFNHWFKVPEDKLQSVLEVATMVHNATLLFDDIQDGSVVRRGMPAAHCIYGLPLTMNAAVQVLTMALQKALELVPNGLAAHIYAEQFVDAVYGQGIDIYWRENFVCPTETEHKKMVQQKTGRIIMFGVKLLQLFSENKTNYEDLVMLLGLYFQLRDDYCNLKQQEALEEWPGVDDVQVNTNNNFCEDITEGKFSLSIIHSKNTPEGPQIFNILRQRTRDVEMKRYCVSLLEKSGSLQYTRDVLSECDCKVRAEALEEWPGVDDVQVNTNNNFCEDITEGKFSLSIIHSKNTPEGPQIFNILRQRTRDVEMKRYCVSLLEKSGSLQYTRDVLSECDCKVRAELARLGGNPLMEAVLDGLLSWKDGK